MTKNLDDDFALEKMFRDASKAFPPPDGLKEGMRASLLVTKAKADSSNVPGAHISTATRSRTWLWRSSAAAACILLGLLAVWLFSHREEAHKATTGTTAQRPAVVAPPAAPSVDDLPPTEAGLLRAFLQSPQAFDSLPKRKKATPFRTTQTLTDLDTWRILETMDNDKEKNNETRSTGYRHRAVA
jgi:hypothetical protein